MQFIVNSIIEHIAEKEPAPGNETIILINGFDRLIIYAEIAKRLNSRYSDRSISINIKLAKRKWEELSKKSNDLLVQQVEQSGLVADKESVTYYRNLHNVDILILLGTENEEDTGGLINCFTITPDWLINNLEGQYDLIFENCFVSGLSDDDRRYINAAYKALLIFVVLVTQQTDGTISLTALMILVRNSEKLYLNGGFQGELRNRLNLKISIQKPISYVMKKTI